MDVKWRSLASQGIAVDAVDAVDPKAPPAGVELDQSLVWTATGVVRIHEPLLAPINKPPGIQPIEKQLSSICSFSKKSLSLWYLVFVIPKQ